MGFFFILSPKLLLRQQFSGREPKKSGWVTDQRQRNKQPRNALVVASSRSRQKQTGCGCGWKSRQAERSWFDVLRKRGDTVAFPRSASRKHRQNELPTDFCMALSCLCWRRWWRRLITGWRGPFMKSCKDWIYFTLCGTHLCRTQWGK